MIIMDAFGDNFVNEPDVDPAAEFLAREQDQLAGLEDDITPMAVTLAAAAGHNEDCVVSILLLRESAKNAEKQFVAEADEVEPGTEWERIAKLCEFNPKSSRTSKDVSRMRSIILQLKQTPPTPINA
ncbi:clathrin light chain [Pogonomyrmex barbatus]|uniref:Clathrin light chain n=1 Tax=Pogonomyrmex barbatus TaxID=144034 RepID=A0A6I9VTR6_9HYME|nr:clathrin light chain [Pogonomyrmex barbatus]